MNDNREMPHMVRYSTANGQGGKLIYATSKDEAIRKLKAEKPHAFSVHVRG